MPFNTEGDCRVAQFRVQVHQLIEGTAPTVSCIEDLQAGIHSVACKIFPKHPPQRLSNPGKMEP